MTKLRDWQVNLEKDISHKLEISGSGDIENDYDTNDTEDGDDYGWEEKAPPAAFVCSAPRDRNYQSGQVRFQVFRHTFF